MSNKADFILRNGIIVTVDNENTIIENGSIAVKDGIIVEIGKDLSYVSDKIQELCGAIVIPGLINTHTHAGMTLFRGLADDLPLMEWLNDHIFPAEALLNEEFVYAGSLLACLEMLKSGTTCFCDMYFFEDQVAKAAIESGIKVFAGEAIINFPTPSCKAPEMAIDVMKSLYSKYENHDLVKVCAAPHSAYLTDEKYLKSAFEFTAQKNIPFVIHAAESASELVQVENKTGKRPVTYLNDIGVLGENTLSVHSVYLTEEEIFYLKNNKSSVSHNPESNMKLASGIAPIPELLDAGVIVGLGTDGAASNNDLCLLSEMDTAAKLHKVNKLDPTVMSAREVLRMATIDGAKALGIDGETGSLEVGKKADIVVLNPYLPGLSPMYSPESHIVYSASRREVKDVYVNGVQQVGAGRVLNCDVKVVIQEVCAIADIIKKKLFK